MATAIRIHRTRDHRHSAIRRAIRAVARVDGPRHGGGRRLADREWLWIPRFIAARTYEYSAQRVLGLRLPDKRWSWQGSSRRPREIFDAALLTSGVHRR